MRYFTVESFSFDEPGHWSGTYRANHRWHLSGVDCPREGIWSGLSAFPSVDLSAVDEPLLANPKGPTSLEEYKRLVSLARPFVPPELPILAGGSFGPMVGFAQGRFGPVTCDPPWQLILREDAVELLKAEGLQGIIAVRMELRSRRSNMPALYELEARPLAKLHPDCIGEFKTPACETCGRPESFRLPPKRWLLRPSIPEGLDFFGIQGTSKRVVSERFIETVQRLGPSDVHYQELPAAD
ncbi:double-CXXCG motif protein [Corallococcus interemptor]|uniref:SitI6 family double-CXXCG motif immunity protein n=1 Tax=Corallococcus interemptor TaxID=2316720 RepID=UPI003D03DF16